MNSNLEWREYTKKEQAFVDLDSRFILSTKINGDIYKCVC
jgi:hypothetical protein